MYASDQSVFFNRGKKSIKQVG
ncbi:hypothetical protein R3I94_008667 [Phoxinus phoxinus]